VHLLVSGHQRILSMKSSFDIDAVTAIMRNTVED
jgi:hypothetical protein